MGIWDIVRTSGNEKRASGRKAKNRKHCWEGDADVELIATSRRMGPES